MSKMNLDCASSRDVMIDALAGSDSQPTITAHTQGKHMMTLDTRLV
jgi:hypothetical protein